MKTVLVKISKEARQLVKIMSAEEGISSQEFLTNLVLKEYNKENCDCENITDN